MKLKEEAYVFLVTKSFSSFGEELWVGDILTAGILDTDGNDSNDEDRAI